MKQETIEQAAERFYPVNITGNMSMPTRKDIENSYKQEGFINGVEYQKERMFTDKDMKQFAWMCVAKFLSNDDGKVEIKLVEVVMDRVNKVFEKYKKVMLWKTKKQKYKRLLNTTPTIISICTTPITTKR